MGELSFRENGRVSSLVMALSAEHERIAFLVGRQPGTKWMLELAKGGNGGE